MRLRWIGIMLSVVLVAGVAVVGVMLAPKKTTTPPLLPAAPPAAQVESGGPEPDSPEPETPVREPFEPGMLLVGDPAPALSITRWYRGGPTDQVELGRVHVVDLWATWCGPCVRAMPHLSQLQKEYEGDGLRVIAVSIDTAQNADEQVERFIEKRSEDIGFDVALDDGGTARDWLAAAGRQTIPSSYVIDRQGTVVWMGNPLTPDGATGEPVIDRVIREVINGEYDLESATQEARGVIADQQEINAQAERVQELTSTMGEYWAAGDLESALGLIDEIIELDPAGNSGLALRKAEILLAELRRPEEATAYFVELLQGAYADDPETLIQLATLFSGELDPGQEGREAAVSAATIAVGIVDDDPSMQFILARSQFSAGMIEEAIDTMTQARDYWDEGSASFEHFDDQIQMYKDALD